MSITELGLQQACAVQLAAWWQRPEWWTALAAIVTSGTVVLAYGQLQLGQKVERALLVPVWNNFVHINYEKLGDLSHCFSWRFANFGKGPAFIHESFGTMVLIDAVSSLPREPRYGTPVRYKGDPLIPGKSLDNPFYSPLSDDREFAVIEEEYRRGGKTVYAYGYVKYRDAVGGKHETRFGVRYRAGQELTQGYDGFLIDGPEAYNAYL